jgi:hypothetical protein
MKPHPLILCFAVLAPVMICAQNKPKKQSGLSAAFENARYVYVKALEGDALRRPEVYPEDRQAIEDVENGVRNWNRYVVTTNLGDADLVFVVRKARAVGAQVRGGIGVGQSGPRQQSGQDPRQTPTGDSVGAGMEVGPADDLLQVYITNPEGRLVGPIWTRDLIEGLDGPTVPLLRQLRAAVEKAYPAQVPAKQP